MSKSTQKSIEDGRLEAQLELDFLDVIEKYKPISYFRVLAALTSLTRWIHRKMEEK